MSVLDPKSTEQLREIAGKVRRGEHVSKNDVWELDQAKKKGVKGIEPNTD